MLFGASLRKRRRNFKSARVMRVDARCLVSFHTNGPPYALFRLGRRRRKPSRASTTLPWLWSHPALAIGEAMISVGDDRYFNSRSVPGQRVTRHVVARVKPDFKELAPFGPELDERTGECLLDGQRQQHFQKRSQKR